jgi:hypothetical protein
MTPQIYTSDSRADLKRSGTCDESAKTSEGAAAILAWHWGESCSCCESAEIGGASVTVSRTHTGFSLCLQIITTSKRSEAKQGRALFLDTLKAEAFLSSGVQD